MGSLSHCLYDLISLRIISLSNHPNILHSGTVERCSRVEGGEE